MDAALLISLLAVLVTAVNVGWSIYSGRKTLQANRKISAFEELKGLLASTQEDSRQKAETIKNLEDEVDQLKARIVRLERKNSRLIRALASATKIPVDILEIQLDGDDEISFPPRVRRPTHPRPEN